MKGKTNCSRAIEACRDLVHGTEVMGTKSVSYANRTRCLESAFETSCNPMRFTMDIGFVPGILIGVLGTLVVLIVIGGLQANGYL